MSCILAAVKVSQSPGYSGADSKYEACPQFVPITNDVTIASVGFSEICFLPELL